MVRARATDDGAAGDKPVRRCYVAAPTKFSRRKLESAIRDAGFEPVDATDLTEAPASASEAVLQVLKKADAVVGVVDEQRFDNSNVLVELGMAVALGKRVIILGDLARQPPQLADAVWLRGKPDDYEPVRFALSHLESVPRKSTSARPRKSLSQKTVVEPIPAEAYQHERALIDFLAETFENAGGIAIGREAPGDRFDLGLWSGDASWVVGNPIMVEVKTRVDSLDQLRRIAADIEGRIAGTNVEWALLIYARGLDPASAQDAALGFHVLPFRLDDLVVQLESGGLAELLRRARNIRAHS